MNLSSNQDIVLTHIKAGINTCNELAIKIAKSERSINRIVADLEVIGMVTIDRTVSRHIYTANAEIVPFVVRHRRARKNKVVRTPELITDQPLTEEQREALQVYRGLKEEHKPTRGWLAKFIGLPKPVMMRYLQLEVI